MPLTNPTSQNAFLNDIIVSRLRNGTNVAEGSNLPPPLKNAVRIPSIYGLRIAATTAAVGGGTDFTLTWLTPENIRNISTYNVYALNAFQNSLQPVKVTDVSFPPAIVHVGSTDTGRKITFFIEPQLHNGLKGEVNFNSPTANGQSCPSCVGILL